MAEVKHWTPEEWGEKRDLTPERCTKIVEGYRCGLDVGHDEDGYEGRCALASNNAWDMLWEERKTVEHLRFVLAETEKRLPVNERVDGGRVDQLDEILGTHEGETTQEAAKRAVATRDEWHRQLDGIIMHNQTLRDKLAQAEDATRLACEQIDGVNGLDAILGTREDEDTVEAARRVVADARKLEDVVAAVEAVIRLRNS